MPNVTLRVDGNNYEGWESIDINKSLNTLSGTFSLSISNKWANNLSKWPISIGAECTVLIDNKTVITGYVDVINSSFSSNSHQIQISGRDKVSDLIDCSVINIDQMRDVSFINIAKKICEPFNISVIDKVGLTEKIREFKIQPSETAYEALSRLSKTQGVLVVANNEGNIDILRSGTQFTGTGLVQSLSNPNQNNIKSASINNNLSNRFSKYIVKSQLGAIWANQSSEESRAITGTSTDESITRNRPTVILAEGQATIAEANDRANWENTIRASRGTQVTCVLDGWTQENNDLWNINQLVNFKSDYFNIDTKLLITSLRFSLNLSSGSQTTLTLSRPDAFSPEPTKKSDLELWRALAN